MAAAQCHLAWIYARSSESLSTGRFGWRIVDGHLQRFAVQAPICYTRPVRDLIMSTRYGAALQARGLGADTSTPGDWASSDVWNSLDDRVVGLAFLRPKDLFSILDMLKTTELYVRDFWSIVEEGCNDLFFLLSLPMCCNCHLPRTYIQQAVGKGECTDAHGKSQSSHYRRS